MLPMHFFMAQTGQWFQRHTGIMVTVGATLLTTFLMSAADGQQFRRNQTQRNQAQPDLVASNNTDASPTIDDTLVTGSLSDLVGYQALHPTSDAVFDIRASLVFAASAWRVVMVCDEYEAANFRVGLPMAEKISRLKPGAIIRLRGRLIPGRNSFEAVAFQVDDSAAPPMIVDTNLVTDPRNQAFGRFVETTGLVREVLLRKQRTIYSTRVMGVPVYVKIHDQLTLEDAMTSSGRMVRVRAGLRSNRRDDNSPTEYSLLVMRREQVEVLTREGDKNFYRPLDHVQEPISTEKINSLTLRGGLVAYTDAENTIVVCNRRESFVVHTEMAPLLTVGQRVNVFGNDIQLDDRAIQMRSRVIAEFGEADFGPPVQSTVAKMQSGKLPPRVSVDAKVVSCMVESSVCRLILQDHQRIFQAIIPLAVASDVESAELFTPGSYISLVAAPIRLPFVRHASVPMTSGLAIQRVPLTLFAASPNDITIRSSPYLFHPNEVIAAIGLTGLVLLGGLIWNRSLTRQVAHRTARLNSITSHLETAFDAIQEGVILVDADGIVVRKNQRFEDLFDSSPRIGEPIVTFFEQLSRTAPVSGPEMFWQTARRNVDQGFHGELKCKSTQRTLQVYSHPIVHHGGDFTDGGSNRGRLWAFTDVTEQRRLEEQLFRAQKMELIGQLSGGIAHDFNNLLTVIRTSLSMIDRTTHGTSTAKLIELATDDGPAEERRLNEKSHTSATRSEPKANGSAIVEFTEAAHKAVDRAVELTGHLLDYSRRSRLDIAVVDINHVVRGVYQLIRRTLPTTIEIAVRATPCPAPARVDLAKIEQVVINLCKNACDAIGDRPGYLFLETRLIPDDDLGESVVITIRDDGHGIDEADRDRIFEPFFTTKSNGTGLGLAMALGVIENHGGRIECRSKPDVGTEFNIWLPKAKGEAPPSPPGVSHRGNQSLTESDAKLRLLIVDDTPRDRQTAETLFAELGHDVVSTSSGESAIEYLGNADRFDLVILDHHISGLPAAEVYRQIRRRWPGQRVALCSRPTERDRTQRAVLTWDHLPPIVFTKPFRVDELHDLLNRCTTSIDKPASRSSS